MGVIDESAIDRLFLVAELTKNICLSANSTSNSGAYDGGDGHAPPVASEAELAAFFPPFVWLLRDFSLKIQKDGEDITVAEYMENSLEDRPGNSRKAEDINRIRRSFKKLFHDRTCATLVRPVMEEVLHIVAAAA